MPAVGDRDLVVLFVQVLHREGDKWVGGLAGAVAAGITASDVRCSRGMGRRPAPAPALWPNPQPPPAQPAPRAPNPPNGNGSDDDEDDRGNEDGEDGKDTGEGAGKKSSKDDDD